MSAWPVAVSSRQPSPSLSLGQSPLDKALWLPYIRGRRSFGNVLIKPPFASGKRRLGGKARRRQFGDCEEARKREKDKLVK